MLRVGYVLKRFPRLSETFVLNELLELERQGVEVVVFSLLRPPEEPRHARLFELAAPLHYLPGGSLLDGWRVGAADGTAGGGTVAKRPLTALLAEAEGPWPPLLNGKDADAVATLHLKAATVALLAQAHRLDHLHAHFASDATTVALLAGRLAGLPVSFTAHARDIYHRYTDPGADAAMRRAKLAEARFVVTVSDYNRRHLEALARGTPARIHRLHNGLDLGRVRPRAKPREPGRFLAVGRLIEKKGFIHLIEACRELARLGRPFLVEIVGEGPERERLAAATAAVGLGQAVRLLGALPQEALLERLARASAMVLPCVVGASGDRDGLPTVLLEALATATPAISTTLGGIDEVIEDGVSGLLVPPGDGKALAAAMARLADDPLLAAAMGAAGRERAEAAFDLARNVARLRRLFAGAAGAQDNDPHENRHAHRLRVG
jgi:glycosyltransferase involved in cell wall biosynthesis